MADLRPVEPVLVRPRRPEDVPVVGELILRQQPLTGYPLRRPLRMPVEQFVARPRELAAWVAVVGDGPGARVAGHVSVTDVSEDEVGPLWAAAVGRAVTGLAAVSVLVVDHELTGRGIGKALMDVCESHVAAAGRVPVLEVMGVHARAAALYRARGWEVVGTARPHWLPDDEDPVELMVLRPPAGCLDRDVNDR